LRLIFEVVVAPDWRIDENYAKDFAGTIKNYRSAEASRKGTRRKDLKMGLAQRMPRYAKEKTQFNRMF
jgi:hypothetical protein